VDNAHRASWRPLNGYRFNSSLAVVIGYPDLVSIANTSINQNGQALEVIVVIMAVYLSLNLVVAVVMGAINARVTRAPR